MTAPPVYAPIDLPMLRAARIKADRGFGDTAGEGHDSVLKGERTGATGREERVSRRKPTVGGADAASRACDHAGDLVPVTRNVALRAPSAAPPRADRPKCNRAAGAGPRRSA